MNGFLNTILKHPNMTVTRKKMLYFEGKIIDLPVQSNMPLNALLYQVGNFGLLLSDLHKLNLNKARNDLPIKKPKTNQNPKNQNKSKHQAKPNKTNKHHHHTTRKNPHHKKASYLEH